MERAISQRAVAREGMAWYYRLKGKDRETKMNPHEKGFSTGERSEGPGHDLSLGHLELSSDQREKLQTSIGEVEKAAGGDPAVLAAIAEYFALQAGYIGEESSVSPRGVPTGEDSSEMSVDGTAVDGRDESVVGAGMQEKRERLVSPEQLARETTAYSLDFWAFSGGATPKASKGIDGIYDHSTNEARRMAYGSLGFDALGAMTQLRRFVAEQSGGDARKGGQLRPGEGMVVRVLEEREPTKQEYETGEYNAQDATFLITFRSSKGTADNPDGGRDDVSLAVTLPRRAVEEVQRDPDLLADMIPYLIPEERYKRIAKDLKIREPLTIGPERLKELARSMGVASSSASLDRAILQRKSAKYNI